MEQEIKEFLEYSNEEMKKIIEMPKEELKILKNLFNLEQIRIDRKNEKEFTDQMKVKIVKACLDENYSFLEYVASFKYMVESNIVGKTYVISDLMKMVKCDYCECENCYKKISIKLIQEITKYNKEKNKKINPINILNFLLEKNKKEFNSVPDEKFFEKINIMDLIYIQIILEMDLIKIKNINKEEKIIEIEYLDLSSKNNEEYYINKINNFYKNKKQGKIEKINLNEIENIYTEKNKIKKLYKISGYYKYLIEKEKINIIKKLKEILDKKNKIERINIRSRYFINKYFLKVEELPYSIKTKEKIKNILNYILNYRYKKSTPYIPINILVYTDDKEGVKKISSIIGEFMWFFGYLPEKMGHYNEFINNIILDKFSIKNLYYTKEGRKAGILLINNFENILYTDRKEQNLILNILTDEIEKSNNSVCTIIYGKKEIVKQIIGNHHKLSQYLINLELEMDDLDEEKIYDLIINQLKKYTSVSDEVKVKIHNYIKATYKQSDIQNIEYMNKLYNSIILKMNKSFSNQEKHELLVEHIPEAYNTTDLPTIMKNMNQLVGLTEIKEQIDDLIALLKFNKKANINIKDFNLHMIFYGNSGTGKTTVGRLITEVFYNLGYIKQNKLTEVTAKDLIAEYVGQTSGKTYNVVKSALGGVLFIDEAYALTMGEGERTVRFGSESIATLLKLMEDYKDKLIIIFAGYEQEMKEFAEMNPGLVSRIGYKINFPDFSLEELKQIYLNLLKENNLTITEDAINDVEEVIKQASKTKNFGNARYINNIFQKILIQHANNIEKKGEDDLYLIKKEDIVKEKLIPEDNNKRIGF